LGQSCRKFTSPVSFKYLKFSIHLPFAWGSSDSKQKASDYSLWAYTLTLCHFRGKLASNEFSFTRNTWFHIENLLDKRKNLLSYIFWKETRKTIWSIFLDKHREKSLKNVPLYINFETFENYWKYLLYISFLLKKKIVYIFLKHYLWLLQGVNISTNLNNCDFACAGSRKIKNGQDLASVGDQVPKQMRPCFCRGSSAKNKCDLASAGGQHINKFKQLWLCFYRESKNKEWPRPCFCRGSSAKNKCDLASAEGQHIKTLNQGIISH